MMFRQGHNPMSITHVHMRVTLHMRVTSHVCELVRQDTHTKSVFFSLSFKSKKNNYYIKEALSLQTVENQWNQEKLTDAFKCTDLV